MAELSLTTKQGQSVQAQVVSVVGSVATITRNNQRSTVRLDQLSDESRAQVVQAAKDKGAYQSFPPFKVQVVVGTTRTQDDRISYKKNMAIKPQITIAGSSTLEPMPEGEATMMIITMDTRAKYVGKKDRYVVHTVETKPIPAAPDGKARKIDFEPSSVSFDSWRDKTNVGGFVYKYYVFALRDAETKKIVDFQTNHQALQTYVQRAPEKRDEILGLKQGAEYKEFR